MPGLGWALKKSVFLEEMIPKWPHRFKNFHWDFWMRDNRRRKNRNCIVPTISRTFHLGRSGNIIDAEFFRKHFHTKPHSYFSVKSFNLSFLINNSYDQLIETFLKYTFLFLLNI